MIEVSSANIKKMLENNYKQGKTKMRAVIMINYAPVMLYSVKPFYLTAFLEKDNLRFGYCSNKNMPDIEYLIPESKFRSILQERTIAKECGLTYEETPKILKEYYNNREIIKCELILNTSKFGKFALNFITSDYQPFREQVCRNINQIHLTEGASDKITRYCIFHQTAMDSYLYFHGALTQISKTLCKLNNSICTSFQIDYRTSLIRILCSAKDINVKSVAEKKVTITDSNNEERLINPVVTIDGYIGSNAETVICSTLSSPKFSGESEDVLKATYLNSGMIVLKEHFSEKGTSGFTSYRQFTSEYFDCLAVNTYMYAPCLFSNKRLPYGARLEQVTTVGGRVLYEFNEMGTTTLRDLMIEARGGAL